jgi:hypothetical protein
MYQFGGPSIIGGVALRMVQFFFLDMAYMEEAMTFGLSPPAQGAP